ncbi:hypothetical protein GOODEAATRI_021283 [Goodea atripinnis]|uniref:Uncharacterized protein n=1 Tax=Goodea atripinnis TaxID=208336 RepID=A0ABV0NWV5_9TELE
MPKASHGYGGKFGVQQDRMDKVGASWVSHADRVDQSAVGFDYQGKTEKHESQKGLFPPCSVPTGTSRTWTLTYYAKGFGGKFGVETDKVDKSAVGFEYQGKTEQHESQKGQWSLKRVQVEPERGAAHLNS